MAKHIHHQKITYSMVAHTGWHTDICALLPLPALDEIVGGRQFEKLCKENSTIHVNRTTAVGRKVYLADTPDVEIKGTWVRIVLKPWRFIDAKTGELVLSYNTLRAQGGRLLKISERHVPLTFNGYCAPAESPVSIETFRPYGINYIEPPLTHK